MTASRRLAAAFLGLADWLDPSPPPEIAHTVAEELFPPSPDTARLLADIARAGARVEPSELGGVQIFELEKMARVRSARPRKHPRKPDA